jgi:hypothetical protein
VTNLVVSKLENDHIPHTLHVSRGSRPLNIKINKLDTHRGLRTRRAYQQMTDLQETNFLCFFGLTNVHYYCMYLCVDQHWH